MSGRFESVLAEVAYMVTLDGFALEEFGTVEGRCGWNALVEMDASTLDEIEDEELREEFDRTYGNRVAAGALVWIRQDAQGFVDVVIWGHDAALTSGTDRVSRLWDDFVEEITDDE